MKNYSAPSPLILLAVAAAVTGPPAFAQHKAPPAPPQGSASSGGEPRATEAICRSINISS